MLNPAPGPSVSAHVYGASVQQSAAVHGYSEQVTLLGSPGRKLAWLEQSNASAPSRPPLTSAQVSTPSSRVQHSVSVQPAAMQSISLEFCAISLGWREQSKLGSPAPPPFVSAQVAVTVVQHSIWLQPGAAQAIAPGEELRSLLDEPQSNASAPGRPPLVSAHVAVTSVQHCSAGQDLWHTMRLVSSQLRALHSSSTWKSTQSFDAVLTGWPVPHWKYSAAAAPVPLPQANSDESSRLSPIHA